ncbi:MAG TPA: matrixin family metalloprotease [Pyrinomonadaceae bacterium]|nr:matrixin family metalloprotease [Pyrinomonadaceae bacterium]
MQYLVAIVASVALFLGTGPGGRLEIRDSSEVEPTAQTTRRIRWPRRTIEVAFSTSMMTPGTNIKQDSDVTGAARRALARWSSLANINFIVIWSPATSVSPADAGDGISLITIADTIENEAFNSDTTAGRTRVFFDPETGDIAEADVSINPRPRAEDGTEIQFSTDGTPGTYDLEATFTHEIGHLLGLDHSAVIGSTMQGRQAFNGTFGLPALTERTLSEDDRQKLRSLYGPKQKLGRIEGRLADNRTPGALIPLSGVNVWAENVATGRVIASDVSAEDGSYHLEGLTPGQYRVMVSPRADDGIVNGAPKFRSFEVSNLVTVKSDNASSLNYHLVPPQASALSPKVIGLNAELSTVPLPVEPGKRVKIYFGGEGVDQVPGTSIAVNSPFFTVDPGTLVREQINAPFPVVSVEVQIAANAPFGDYTLRLQSNSGETAFVPGAITIDPAVAAPISNPVDDFRFFINQHYSDMTGRTADATVIEKLTTQLSQCGTRAECLRAARLDISSSLLANELPSNALFLNSLYGTSLGRRPRLAEFEKDRAVLLSEIEDQERGRMMLAAAFAQRPEFKQKYAATLKPAEFVDAVIATAAQFSSVDLSSERDALIALAEDPNAGRAAVLTRLATKTEIADAQYNPTLVMVQYFAYLRREPDEAGFTSWLNTLKNKPLRDAGAARSMACSFLNSEEYQSRFGLLTTHTTRECN